MTDFDSTQTQVTAELPSAASHTTERPGNGAGSAVTLACEGGWCAMGIQQIKDVAFIAAQWHAARAQVRADAGDERSRQALAVLVAWQIQRLIGGAR